MPGPTLSMCNLSILVYHHIALSGGEKHPRMGDSVFMEDFARQMRLLKERRFNVMPLARLASAMKTREAIPARTVAITFDDGYGSTCSRAAPILRQHGFAASVFLATDYIGSPAPFPWLPVVSDRQALPMNWRDAGAISGELEIGSHTATHRFPPRMEMDEIEGELRRSKEQIGEKLGHAPSSLALPFSFPLRHRNWPSFYGRLLAAMKANSYSCCCTLQRGRAESGEGVLFLPRIAIKGDDGLRSFHAKALGLYRYTNPLQRVFQAFFKSYDAA